MSLGTMAPEQGTATVSDAVDFTLANLLPALRAHRVRSVLELGWGTDSVRTTLTDGQDDPFEVFTLAGQDDGNNSPSVPLKFEPLMDGRLWRQEGWGQSFDAAVCVNLLQRVPLEHLPAVLRNLRRHITRIGFFAVGLDADPPSAAAPDQPPAVALKPPAWWLTALQQAGFRALDHRLQRDKAGKRDLWLYVYVTPAEGGGTAKSALPGAAKSVPLAKLAPEQLLQVAMQVHRAGRVEDAESLYQQVLGKDESNADALHGLGMIATDRDELDAGEALIRRAIAVDGGKPSYHSNLGHLLKLRRDFEGALASHERALALAPESAEALNNLGDTLRDAGQIEAAGQALRRAIEADPSLVTARWNLCQVELTRGNFAAGWDLFRWGFEARSRKWYGLPLPEYGGDVLETGGVALWGDWGIGDQVMFLRLLPDLLLRVPSCVCVCDERLVPILGRSFPSVRIQAPVDPLTLRQRCPDLTHHLAISDLGRVLCPEPSDLPAGSAFLKADRDRAGALRAKYQRNDELLVGIAWRGGGKQETRAQRSIDLLDWGPVLETPGVRFVSLQNGDPSGDIAEVARETGVDILHDREIDQMNSLEDFCAQIAALDAVISVDCTAVHLAGALGVPTKVLLPFVPDWRWGLEGTRTAWYDSLELFRQTTNGNWQGPIDLVAATLKRSGAEER